MAKGRELTFFTSRIVLLVVGKHEAAYDLQRVVLP